MTLPTKTYRICFYDGARDTVMSDWIDAATDDEALARAQSFGFTKCELWDGHRLVAELDGEQNQAA